ncbi:MAG: hypothetical protein JWO57_3254 [Pseudonocardiales bacterium]|nr:hypothetical protein [Pseudonocardiales bacterium]
MFEQATSRRRLFAASALTAAVLALAVPLVSEPAAAAAVINDPPANGHSVIVFPQRDFVHGDGFAVGANLRVEIWRGTVEVGVSDPFVNDNPAGFDLNHLGAPCWASVTPDIIPGDMVQVVNLDSGEIDRTFAANVIVNQKATKVGNTVVIKGTAAQADGTQIPVAQLDARVVASTKSPFSDGTRTIRSQPVYDTSTGNTWTTTFTTTKNGTPLTSADLSLAVASESRGMWLGRLVGLAVPPENTIYEAGAFGGPAAGCSAPSASDAVTGSTPSAVNVAAVQPGGNLLLSGTSFNAASGTLSLTDGVTATPLTAPVSLNPAAASTDPTVPLPGNQTWTASIPTADVAGLADGTLTASVSFTRVLASTHPDPVDPTVQVRDTGTLAGASRTLLKDVVAPQAPTASVPGGTYFDPQTVTLNPADPAHDTVRYTIANPTAPDPSPFSTVASVPIQVTSSQQLKAMSIDPAGNQSTVLTTNYVITTRTAPEPPTAISAVAGDASAIVSWTPPATDGGSPITNYQVDVFQGGVRQPTLGQAAGTATSWTIGALSNGVAYQFTVLAQNSIGSSPRSAPSTVVTPSPLPAAQAVVTPNAVNFGSVPLGGTGTTQTVTLSNTGNATLSISSITVSGAQPSDFALGATTCGVTLAAAASCTTAVSFTPGATGARSAAFAVTDSSPGSPHIAALTGTGTSAVSVPTVTTRNPLSGATGVAIGTATARVPMTATFSEAVSGLPATAAATGNFTLKQGTTAVASKVVYNATTHVATLTPDAALIVDKPYTLSLSAAIKSASGGALVAQGWNFITGPRPTVTATNPASGASGVAIGTAVARTAMTATFSEGVTGLPITAAATGNFTLHQGTTTVTSKVVYNATTHVATLTPDTALIADKTYTLTVSAAIKDIAGNPITAKTWNFISGPRPTVTARTPAVNGVNVARTANCTATFSEAVAGLPTTAAATGNFTIKQTATGAAFASMVSYNATTRVATLNPTGTLLANTRYTISLTTGIKDTAGNTLTALTWTFTTGAA